MEMNERGRLTPRISSALRNADVDRCASRDGAGPCRPGRTEGPLRACGTTGATRPGSDERSSRRAVPALQEERRCGVGFTGLNLNWVSNRLRYYSTLEGLGADDDGGK